MLLQFKFKFNFVLKNDNFFYLINKEIIFQKNLWLSCFYKVLQIQSKDDLVSCAMGAILGRFGNKKSVAWGQFLCGEGKLKYTSCPTSPEML